MHILQFKSLPLTISPRGEEVRGSPNCSLSYQILYIHSFKVHTTFFACYVREARDAFVAKVVGDKFLTINDIGTIKDIAHTKLCIFHLHYFKAIPFDVAKATATIGLPRNNQLFPFFQFRDVAPIRKENLTTKSFLIGRNPLRLLKLLIAAKSCYVSQQIKRSDAWFTFSIINIPPHAFERCGADIFVCSFKDEFTELCKLVVILHLQPRLCFYST